jgi:ABC-type glycerol-3-phosphate transport system substrate-binding protein
MKRVIFTLLVVGLLLSITMCGPGQVDPKTFKGTMSMWSFTDEVKKMIDRFESVYTGVKVELTIVPCEEYLNKIRPVLRSGKNAPDVFTAEYSNVIDLVESGFYADLGEFNPNTGDLVEYVVGVGTDSGGKLRALSWQTTPGGFFFRRSVAKKYLGTDDPEEVGEMLSTVDKLLDVGRKLKDESGGAVKVIAGYGDYQQYAWSHRTKPFVSDGKLNIEQSVLDYFDTAKTMRDEQLTAEVGTWSPAWFENMNKAEPEVFGYILPTWGLHYVIKPNAKDTMGDWGLCKGPGSYFWGGTWMGIYKNSENKAIAWEFVKMFTLDEETLTWWATETGDFLGNAKVVEQIKNDFADELLAEQNHYLFFAAEASKVNGKLLAKYDLDIRNFLMGAINNYVEGTMTKDEAIEQFKADVMNAYPDIQVD